MAFSSFANIYDLEARWRPLNFCEKKKAKVLLLDASALIINALSELGQSFNPSSEEQKQALIAVNCSIVKRAMQIQDDESPAKSITQQAGVYSETVSYVNPAGDLYLSAAEKNLLGGHKQRIDSFATVKGCYVNG